MNPLTLVKRIQNINSKEAALGISEDASWHAKYKESAYVFVGGIPFDLTEGDLLAVFSQCGEIVDVNLVRDKGTGKSKGFAFIAYEDQRSTTLAVDNLNGAQILGRIIRVDHVSNYKKKEEEDEEKEQQKREARGVCRAFQKGECNRGASCKFSHDEQRNANTGWGPKDSSWDHDKYEGPSKRHKRSGNISSDLIPKSRVQEGASMFRSDDKDAKMSRAEGDEKEARGHRKRSEADPRDQDRRGLEKRSERNEKESNYPEERDRQAIGKRSVLQESDRKRSEADPRDQDRRGLEKRSERNEKESNYPEERDRQAIGKRSVLQESDRKRSEADPRDQDRRGLKKRSERNEKESNYPEERDRQAIGKRSVLQESDRKRSEADPRDQDRRGLEKRPERNENESNYLEERDKQAIGKKSVLQESELNSRDSDRRGREEKKSGRHESEPNPKGDQDERGHDRRSRYDSSSSIRHQRKEDELEHERSRRVIIAIYAA
ncbi:hypothetical protein HHK36_016219 [Tetracentron sinense]|uniref:Uncharacterized protein n=1 Tax=Tetracentron sinense TaxID=13715 RepID=A0A835DBR2_TETSI|nr:hypothetical protein HHK36_016219 [Tetracentron sinense]